MPASYTLLTSHEYKHLPNDTRLQKPQIRPLLSQHSSLPCHHLGRRTLHAGHRQSDRQHLTLTNFWAKPWILLMRLVPAER